MPITVKDISLVLSGGSSNLDPDDSMGGDPSSQPITGVLNNLFSDVTTEDSEAGTEQFRCFYIFNDNPQDPFYDVKLSVTSQVAGGASVQIGARFSNESQKVTIQDNPNGGSAVLLYETTPVMFAGDADPAIMAQSLADALNSTGVAPGSTVVGSEQTDNGQHSVTLTIFFQGQSRNRSHDLLTVQSNSLTNGGDITVQRLTSGGPVNSIADDIDVDVTPPVGVQFAETATTPLSLGNLLPNDGAPIWVRRVVPPSTDELDADGFTLTVTGTPFL